MRVNAPQIRPDQYFGDQGSVRFRHPACSKKIGCKLRKGRFRNRVLGSAHAHGFIKRRGYGPALPIGAADPYN